MAISTFAVEIGVKLTMINSNSNIKDIDFLSKTLMWKLEIGMKIVEFDLITYPVIGRYIRTTRYMGKMLMDRRQYEHFSEIGDLLIFLSYILKFFFSNKLPFLRDWKMLLLFSTNLTKSASLKLLLS